VRDRPIIDPKTDALIAFYVDLYGKKWVKISKEVKTLDGVQIRNRYYS